MDTKDIDDFFKQASKEIPTPTTIVLVGGAAALLMGGVRPTEDIDFAVTSKSPADLVAQGIAACEKSSGIRTEYAEDIERWSMITLLDYKKHTRPYKTFGKLKVAILEPEYWSIGKVGRYYDSDVSDMVVVFKKQKTDPKKVSRVWGRSLRESPLSDDFFHFRKHACHFAQTYGKKIWGSKFDAGAFIKAGGFDPVSKHS